MKVRVEEKQQTQHNHRSNTMGLSLTSVAKATPQGRAGFFAYKNRKQANKLASVAKKTRNPKTASAAKVLAKAKAGDPKAKQNIVKVNRLAKAGDPNAKQAVARLKLLNRATQESGPIAAVNRAYHYGISG